MYLRKDKIIALTQGSNVPSTRFRWSQYVDELEREDFDVLELPSNWGAYAPKSNFRRPLWLAANGIENLFRTIRANQGDLRFLQRNLTATLCTWEPFLRQPLVFDVDDAIFLESRGSSVDRIARSASLIICGNNFLADYFSKFGPVAILPTAVDADRFIPRSVSERSELVIGWSGTSSGFKYLYDIEPALKILLRKYPNVFFKVVSDSPPDFKLLSGRQLIYERWREEREVDVLQEFSVGIMPLEDSLWARGKCSFKMLTYMAVGLPTVVSPVGMNLEILRQGQCGYSANTIDDWVDAVSALLDNSALRSRMGLVGRRILETFYAKRMIAPKLVQLLREQF